eukprot:1942726-Amphidinium_carterae.1
MDEDRPPHQDQETITCLGVQLVGMEEEKVPVLQGLICPGSRMTRMLCGMDQTLPVTTCLQKLLDGTRACIQPPQWCQLCPGEQLD